MKAVKRTLAVVLALVMIVTMIPVTDVSAAVKLKAGKTIEKSYYAGTEHTIKLNVSGLKVKKTVWKVGKSAIVKLVESGKKSATFKCKKAGSTAITAKVTTDKGAKTFKIKVTVKAPVVTVAPTAVGLQVGGSQALSVSCEPKKNTSVTYASDNAAVASVDSQGIITAVGAGEAKIKVTMTCGSKKKSVEVVVTVKEAPKTEDKDKDKEPVKEEEKAPDGTPYYTVTFNSCGGTAVASQKVKKYDQAQAPVDPTYAGYEFAGWYTAEFAGYKFDFIAPITGDITLYAQWRPISVSSGSSASRRLQTGTDTVRTKEELLALLARPKKDTVEFVTEDTITDLELSGLSALCRQVNLVIDAPNASITNKTKFKSVKVKRIAAHTYEEAAGNAVTVTANTGRIIVSGNVEAKIELIKDEVPVGDGTAGAIELLNRGRIASLTIRTDGRVNIIGNESTQASIPTIIQGRATVYTTNCLSIVAETQANLILGEGAEGTTVSVTNEDDKPIVSGLGTVTVIVNNNEEIIYATTNEGVTSDVEVAYVKGVIKNLQAEVVSGAAIHLVPYTNGLDFANISGEPRAISAADGTYAITGIKIGNYYLVVNKDGYVSAVQTWVLTRAQENGIDNNNITMLTPDEAETKGTLSGYVADSVDNRSLSGFTVRLRKGQNNLTGTPLQQTVSGAEGAFSFTELPLGYYTIQVLDLRGGAERYISSSRNIFVDRETVDAGKVGVAKTLDEGQIRFILTWGDEASGAPNDLDSHLSGPTGTAGEFFHTYFSDKTASENGGSVRIAELDWDDTGWTGPETTTVYKMYDGVYYFSVHDYTNLEKTRSMELAKSQARVDVYVGNSLRNTYYVPDKEGTLWIVCSYDSIHNTFTALNEMIYESSPSEVKYTYMGAIKGFQENELISRVEMRGSEIAVKVASEVLGTDLSDKLVPKFTKEGMTYEVVKDGDDYYLIRVRDGAYNRTYYVTVREDDGDIHIDRVRLQGEDADTSHQSVSDWRGEIYIYSDLGKSAVLSKLELIRDDEVVECQKEEYEDEYDENVIAKVTISENGFSRTYIVRLYSYNEW